MLTATWPANRGGSYRERITTLQNTQTIATSIAAVVLVAPIDLLSGYYTINLSPCSDGQCQKIGSLGEGGATARNAQHGRPATNATPTQPPLQDSEKPQRQTSLTNSNAWRTEHLRADLPPQLVTAL